MSDSCTIDRRSPVAVMSSCASVLNYSVNSAVSLAASVSVGPVFVSLTGSAGALDESFTAAHRRAHPARLGTR